ncbi:hypothetical protein M9Y10_034334 [Tritrichomonas musculus]|uniref:Uncharacterized protein n=1 Tax=Tritrichomonas musculus TaxID=1915356 RepID=A0ABR2KEM3_9EUKA
MHHFCLLFFLALGYVIVLYVFFGRIIYGGVYWGKLKYWNDGNSAADHIWLIALLQWIFGIVLPIGSFIVNCMIIHSTRPSNCNPYHIVFRNETMAKISFKYSNFPSQSYFDERCSTPRKLFISFLVGSLVGTPIIFTINLMRYKRRGGDEN